MTAEEEKVAAEASAKAEAEKVAQQQAKDNEMIKKSDVSSIVSQRVNEERDKWEKRLNEEREKGTSSVDILALLNKDPDFKNLLDQKLGRGEEATINKPLEEMTEEEKAQYIAKKAKAEALEELRPMIELVGNQAAEKAIGIWDSMKAKYPEAYNAHKDELEQQRKEVLTDKQLLTAEEVEKVFKAYDYDLVSGRITAKTEADIKAAQEKALEEKKKLAITQGSGADQATVSDKGVMKSQKEIAAEVLRELNGN